MKNEVSRKGERSHKKKSSREKYLSHRITLEAGDVPSGDILQLSTAILPNTL